jgi:hypothetical protein
MPKPRKPKAPPTAASRVVGHDWAAKLAFIRGKNEAEAVTPIDVEALFEYIDKLEAGLDESDNQDTFGTEGWRRHFLGEGR